MPKAGEQAPDFALPDQSGKIHTLSGYRGRWVLVYFYPKDDTPGCTKEACAVRDSLPRFERMKAVVLGVSADGVESHKKFAEKYGLPFTLLADPGKKVVNLYGVWREKSFMGKKYLGTTRASFLVGPDGVIKKTYENVKPEMHAEEVLADIETFSA